MTVSASGENAQSGCFVHAYFLKYLTNHTQRRKYIALKILPVHTKGSCKNVFCDSYQTSSDKNLPPSYEIL